MTDEIVRAESTALAVAAEPTFFMPIVEVKQAMERRALIESFTRNVMVDGADYGVIPNTGDRKVLLKPGAEKLTSFFGFVPTFTITHSILDWDGSGEGHGEALIYYRVRCDLERSEKKVGSADASCSSRETKYRWREAGKLCPVCGAAALRKGMEKFGGGYYCDAKKLGGCGTNFKTGHPQLAQIEAMASGGRFPNPDLADLDNTILKMAEKRALVGATLIATNVSDFFTQDMEDFSNEVTSTARRIDPEPQAPPRQETKPVVKATTKATTKAPQAAPKIVEPEPPPYEGDDEDAPTWKSWTKWSDATDWAVANSYADSLDQAKAYLKEDVDAIYPGRSSFKSHELPTVFESYYNKAVARGKAELSF